MDMGASRRLTLLPQHGMGALGDFSPRTSAYDSRICANFQAHNPGHYLETHVAFRIHNLHENKTRKPKTGFKTRPNHPQPGLAFCKTLGINCNLQDMNTRKSINY